MVFGPITSWQIDRQIKETVKDFIWVGWRSKITVDRNSSHEIKRHLLLGRKSMTNLDSILKIRDTTLPTKVHIVKAMVFPVVGDTGCLGLVHWDDPEGWYGEGGGRRVQDVEHTYTCGGFTPVSSPPLISLFSTILFVCLLFPAFSSDAIIFYFKVGFFFFTL